jgi:hypothetical protein
LPTLFASPARPVVLLALAGLPSSRMVVHSRMGPGCPATGKLRKGFYLKRVQFHWFYFRARPVADSEPVPKLGRIRTWKGQVRRKPESWVRSGPRVVWVGTWPTVPPDLRTRPHFLGRLRSRPSFGERGEGPRAGDARSGQRQGWGRRVRDAQFGHQEAWRGSPLPESPPPLQHRECP